MKSKLSLKIFLFYFTLYIISALLSIFFGSTELFSTDNIEKNFAIFIKIFELRINNFLTVSFVGATLAYCGNILQNILKNPLADPFILGISSGGTCLVAFLMLFPLPLFLLPFAFNITFSFQTIAAFIGCMMSFNIIFILRRKIKSVNDEYIYPVIGIIINTFLSSIILFIFSIIKPEKLSEIHNFLIGSIQPLSFYEILFIIIFSIYPFIKLFQLSRFFNVIQFGDDFSKSMAIDPEKIRKECIFFVCILISITVSIAGIISFIGLIIPHLVKKIHRVNSKSELIICIFLGAIVLLNADTLSRILLSPAQLPVGIFTALIGAPFLTMILLKRYNI
ncbi:iron ABC transporter permease [Pigmentibacter sp. JX0631]|uniref:FecCD family ABC transporter permease n=1 Tax=Pigmentibacter sp. JX0631 TaxID=2976982 RepID=UPI00246940C8|nr:iron ABC transporter permease [Pigmentibacter sp. JX0631]WGL61361.1 iron ABC transporter permease [Pigmentibacter sp. JX0631]